MRVLFVNEGSAGPGMLGHAALAAGQNEALSSGKEFELLFRTLPTMGRVSRTLATRDILTAVDPDLQRARWLTVQAVRARRIVQAELKRGPVDVLHLHTHTIGLALGDVMRKVPTLLSVDATIEDWRGIQLRGRSVRHGLSLRPVLARERAMFDRSFAVLPWSSWACDGVARRSPDARIIRHDPGLDLELFRPAAEREPRVRPRVLCVAARFAEKGGDDLLAALDPLLGDVLDLDIVTTGDVADRTGVRVHRLGPGDPALVRLQQQADVFCLPTQEDASPFALREAMACGVAVVSTPIGAIAEILDEGRAGMLVQPGDRDGLRAAVVSLVQDDALRARLGANARARAVRFWDRRQSNVELVRILREAAGS